MADSSNLNNIELNGLKVKSDSLPNDWLITLVNPKTGNSAENMTIAQFTELFLNNNKIWTANNSNPVKYNSNMNADDQAFDEIGYGIKPNGWLNAGPVISFGAKGYIKQIQGPYSDNMLYMRTINNGVEGPWKQFAFKDELPQMTTLKANALTETVVEEVPVSANTPMTLQEDGQPAPITRTIERYEYSIPKMAEMILSLRKELDELKGGVGE